MAYPISGSLTPFKESAFLERYATGGFIDGVWQVNIPTRTLVQVVAYPDSDDYVERTRTGERTIEKIRVFTDFMIRTTQDTLGNWADLVIWHGKRYRLIACQDWSTGDYYEALGELVNVDSSLPPPDTTGSPPPVGGAVYLNDLLDVQATNPQDLQLLYYNGTTNLWEARSFSDIFSAEVERLLGDSRDLAGFINTVDNNELNTSNLTDTFNEFFEGSLHTIFGHPKQGETRTIADNTSTTWTLYDVAEDVAFGKLLMRAVHTTTGAEFVAEISLHRDTLPASPLSVNFSVEKNITEDSLFLQTTVDSNGSLDFTVNLIGDGSGEVEILLGYGILPK